MTAEMNSIETVIENRLQLLAREAPYAWSDPQWTREVKNALAELGKDRQFSVYASQCDRFVKDGEWLYDTAWLSYRGGCLVDVPLVMESEWAAEADVYDDFEKLLLARAGCRLLIFSAATEGLATRLFKELERRARLFDHTSRGDRYLLACWTNNTRLFTFRLVVT